MGADWDALHPAISARGGETAVEIRHGRRSHWGALGGIIPILGCYASKWQSTSLGPLFLSAGAWLGLLLGVGLGVKSLLARDYDEPSGVTGLSIGLLCSFLAWCGTTLITRCLGFPWSASVGQGIIFSFGHFGYFVAVFVVDQFMRGQRTAI